MIEINAEQRAAVDEMHRFADSPEPFFLLEGRAGTGKTTCVQTFARETRKRVVFTAPTNKATKVLRTMCEDELDGTVECRTIYSLLGLRLDSSGEVRVIQAAESCNMAGAYDVVVVDEGSMVNQVLMEHIRRTAMEENVKFLFMGDDTQLPPVGEEMSQVFDIQYRRALTKVERHDNQILTLAGHLRECIILGHDLHLTSDNDDHGGVYRLHWKKLREKARQAFTSDSYRENPGSIKVIAWRNATVNSYNELIREAMYGPVVAASAPFQVGERVVVCQPILNREGDEVLMTTDEEGTVDAIKVEQHPIYQTFLCYRIEVQPELGGPWVTCWVAHPTAAKQYAAFLGDLADQAKAGRGSWKAFWKAKEAIHDVRPCHAITAHRSQGSTYESAFVDAGDILANDNRIEALKCLNVACTRPRRVLVLC